MQDRWSMYVSAIPASEKSSECTRKALQHFFGPGIKPKILYSDCSQELKKACKYLDFLADTSTPHRPQSNGVAERCQRRVKEGTRCVLKQSGLDPDWWPEAMWYYAFARNINDIIEKHGKTAYEVRHGNPFRGQKIAFGTYVEWLSSNPEDKLKMHTFDKKTRQGIFMGYWEKPGGIWSGLPRDRRRESTTSKIHQGHSLIPHP